MALDHGGMMIFLKLSFLSFQNTRNNPFIYVSLIQKQADPMMRKKESSIPELNSLYMAVKLVLQLKTCVIIIRVVTTKAVIYCIPKHLEAIRCMIRNGILSVPLTQQKVSFQTLMPVTFSK